MKSTPGIPGRQEKAREKSARWPHRWSTIPARCPGAKTRAAGPALNTYSADAARLQMLPDVLQSVIKSTEAAAAPLAEIERLSIIGGSA
ncbi:hypothetical protein H7H98_12485, partial [Mycolicibacterium sphagni]|nr:hypothetical protein [Mycolicibacterium sphagni]